MPYLRHVADLVVSELHHVDVVRSRLFAGRLTRTTGTGMSTRKDSIGSDVVSFRFVRRVARPATFRCRWLGGIFPWFAANALWRRLVLRRNLPRRTSFGPASSQRGHHPKCGMSPHKSRIQLLIDRLNSQACDSPLSSKPINVPMRQ
jgi:hypothetical protein